MPGRRTPRCAAKVRPAALEWRSDRGAEPRCRRAAHRRVHGRYYCEQHAELYLTHYWRVARIRAIPARPVEVEAFRCEPCECGGHPDCPRCAAPVAG